MTQKKKKQKRKSTQFVLKDSTESSDDLTAAVVGEFGRWQLCISILMSLLKLPTAWYQLNIIFMTPPQDFWCKKPESFKAYDNAEWRRISAPSVEEHPCLIFDPDIIIKNPTMDRKLVNLVLCPKFEYDTSVFNRTMTSDWNLVCSKHWLAHFTQCVMMWGVLIGSILFGAMADKFGRKPILMYTIIIQSIASFATCVIQSYWCFLFVWFMLALASGGIGVISFVICMEVVSGKWRTTIPVFYQLPFGFGNAIMAGLAYWLRDWRKLEFALAILSSLFILYWFFIPESPRWLIATGQQKEALEVLKRAAKKNNKEYKYENFAHLLTSSHEKPVMLGFMDFLKAKNMRKKTILLSLNWFCVGLAFFTFSQYLGSLGPNIFLTVAFSGLISTPGSIICALLITRTGRKFTVYIFEIFTAICFIFLLMIPKDMFANDWPRLLFAGLGFVGMAGTVPALYLFSGELYPTLGRNVGVGAVSTFARLGSMVAPAVIHLEYIFDELPLVLLAVVSLGQISLLMPLPETRNCRLPDTLEEAENYTKESSSKYC